MRRRVIAACLCAALVVGAIVFLFSRKPPAPRTPDRKAAPVAHPSPTTRPAVPRRRQPIAGRVLAGGQPFAGATVRTIPGFDTVTTGPDGRFEIGDAFPYVREIIAAAPGKRAAALKVPEGAARERMELVLGECETTLTGNVRDVEGGGIARPYLRAWGNRGQTTGETVGDDAGAFVLC